MSPKIRALIIVAVLVIIAGLLAWQGMQTQKIQPSDAAPEEGFIHVYADGQFLANVAPADFTSLPTASYKDAEEGKVQEGPWLRDLVLLYVPESALRESSTITVSGSKKDNVKSHTITWGEALDDSNNLVFDVSGSGDALKLTSTMPDFDVRDEWVQGVNHITITPKP